MADICLPVFEDVRTSLLDCLLPETLTLHLSSRFGIRQSPLGQAIAEPTQGGEPTSQKNSLLQRMLNESQEIVLSKLQRSYIPS